MKINKGDLSSLTGVYRFIHALSSVVSLHAKDLHHAHKDVDEVKLEADTLIDGVSPDKTSLSETGVVQNPLDIVQSEAAEDSQSTIEPETLRPHQCTGGSGWKNERSQAGKSDNSNTC